jgi:hypothetical protein
MKQRYAVRFTAFQEKRRSALIIVDNDEEFIDVGVELESAVMDAPLRSMRK